MINKLISNIRKTNAPIVVGLDPMLKMCIRDRSQAAVLTATPRPAVTQTNQKSAVQTGDSTPIMTFGIILIVAVVCIGGILVYRRKKK